MEKEIEGFPGYTITDDGKVISYKFKNSRIMKTWYQKSENELYPGYENIKLCKDNVCYHKLIHRLVAEAFIPNPNNLPEVNHKNHNRQDNRVENLEWCTRIENLYDSYSTMSPVRNYSPCKLFDSNNNYIQDFISVIAAARYANEQFNCSVTGMCRNHKSKGYYIQMIKCND